MGKLKPLTQPAAKTDLVLYEGVTTSNGNVGGTIIVDSSLIGSNDFLTNATLYIDSGAADKEIRDISTFSNVTGTITVSTAFSTQILNGISYKVLAIIPADIEVAALQADIGDASTSTLGSLYAILGNPTSTISNLQGLIYRGSVTTYTDTTHFKSTNITGFGDNFFKYYYVYVVRDAGGAGAAPQGESKLISAYTSADGTVTHAAFTVPLAVGDEVLLIHPDAATTTVLGGAGFVTATDALHVIAADVAEILDMTVTVDTISVLVTETVLFEDATPSIAINGLSLKVDMTTVITGDTCIIREYYKNLNGSYRQVSDNAANTFVGAQTPVMKVIGLEAYRYGCKITAQVDIATRAMPIEVIREA